ncbi:MAG: hydrogenase iron-sulfur subunit [Peptococcaceae bacterium]|jgi:F420-non-reducing hydrogenase iron-sulfur subunit|nr:hydrogenase iron-sulfur subunit [Peptococcaceae bacterium]
MSVNEALDQKTPTENLENWQPKILVFACNWCTYAGADLTGLSRLQYPATVRILRVPCSGRVNPQFVIKAFQKGVDAVLVCGCHPGDCHYTTGNYFTRRRFLLMRRLMEYIGMEPERLQASWVSAAEAQKFQQLITEVTEQIRALGPNRKLRDVQWEQWNN